MSGPAWMDSSGADWLDRWSRGCDPDIDERMTDQITLTLTQPVSDHTPIDKDTHMKRSQAYPAKYLSKEDIQKPTIGTIDSVVIETVGQGQEQETKPIIYFSGDVLKPMVCNGTNWDIAEALYGDESDDWAGKQIEIWVDPTVMFGGKRTGGLRLRAPQGQPIKNGGTLAERYAALVARATALSLAFNKIDPAADDADITAAGIALKAQIETAEKQPAF